MAKRRVPALHELEATAKKRKVMYEEVKHHLVSLKAVDLTKLPTKFAEKLSEDEIVGWLFGRYGVTTATTIARAVAYIYR